MPYVYLIKSIQYNWVYVGSANDLAKRIRQHNNREVRSTKSKAPLVLIYKEFFETIEEARKREKNIKLSRCIKEDIIKALSSIG